MSEKVETFDFSVEMPEICTSISFFCVVTDVSRVLL